MKKLFIFIMFMMLGVHTIYANINVVMSVVRDTEHQNNKPQHSPYLCPLNVSYEDEHIYIVSNYGIENIQIIVRDATSNIIYNTVIDINDYYTIYLPNDSWYSIECMYDGHHLIGYKQ